MNVRNRSASSSISPSQICAYIHARSYLKTWKPIQYVVPCETLLCLNYCFFKTSWNKFASVICSLFVFCIPLKYTQLPQNNDVCRLFSVQLTLLKNEINQCSKVAYFHGSSMTIMTIECKPRKTAKLLSKVSRTESFSTWCHSNPNQVCVPEANPLKILEGGKGIFSLLLV